MQKRISFNEFQSVKAVAKAIDPIIRERNKIKVKIESLAAEYKSKLSQIEALEAGIVSIIGFHVEDLVKKVIEPTGATSKDGKPVMVTKYLPTDIVSYDVNAKQYVITTPDEPESDIAGCLPPSDTVEAPSTEGLPGSDYDADSTVSQASEQQPESKAFNAGW